MKITAMITSKSNPWRRKQRSEWLHWEEGWSMSCLKIITSNCHWNGCSNEPRAGKRGKWHGQRIKKGDEQDSRRAAAVTGNHHFVQLEEKKASRREARTRPDQTQDVAERKESSIHYQIATGVCLVWVRTCVELGGEGESNASHSCRNYSALLASGVEIWKWTWTFSRRAVSHFPQFAPLHRRETQILHKPF